MVGVVDKVMVILLKVRCRAVNVVIAEETAVRISGILDTLIYMATLTCKR
jgi:hypothetical protein